MGKETSANCKYNDTFFKKAVMDEKGVERVEGDV